MNSHKNSTFFEQLYQIVEEKSRQKDHESYTQSLLSQGGLKIAQKVGEEAVETVIAAVDNDQGALIEESCDLIYHLMVLWVHHGVTLDDLHGVLKAREGISGLQEKRNRSS